MGRTQGDNGSLFKNIYVFFLKFENNFYKEIKPEECLFYNEVTVLPGLEPEFAPVSLWYW